MSATPTTSLWIDRSDRARLRITGPDRAKFLHNLCTNDIKGMKPGQGVEAFITNLQGKTLGYATVLAGDDDLLLRTEPGGFESVLPHLAKYGVFDDVAWEDETASTFEIHLAGDASHEILTDLGLTPPGPRPLDHLLIGTLRVVRESPFGAEGITILGPREEQVRVESRLSSMRLLAAADAETLRIEAGTPAFGREVSAENLPQEIARDAQAISFVKGCYLGQETVARLDALGHVNKILRGLRILEGPIPPPGARLTLGAEPVGKITSSAKSSDLVGAVALGIVKVKHAEAGAILTWDAENQSGQATVVNLPMIPIAETRETS